MQNIFAYLQCRQSDYHLTLDLIREQFAPDLNSMEVQDPVKLEENRKAASDLFIKSHEERRLQPTHGYTPEQASAASDALSYYNKLVQQDFDHLRKSMVAEAEKIAGRYLLFLILLLELQRFANRERETRLEKGRTSAAGTDEENWLNNRVLKILEQNKTLQTEAIRQNLNWREEQDFVRELYRDVLQRDEAYQEYLKMEQPDFEADQKIVLHVIKKIFFKHELVESFMERLDIYWSENREVLKSMVQRTVKELTPESDSNVELAVLSVNWEDDREFFIDLYKLTIQKEPEFEELIASKSKNWDVERLALLDKIILMMALCEMINFTSIPVKVTINEYIELSKRYSTPKSKIFVNGILDVLSVELQEKGIIRKSGRGLIDNK
ncbi:nusb antitermination factor [Flammeovirgaceae bacterium 311]|nr:nusb antitermination factor [Flammeovirgaceae bacterium 311]